MSDILSTSLDPRKRPKDVLSESCNPAVVASRDARGSLFLLRGRAGQKKIFRAGSE